MLGGKQESRVQDRSNGSRKKGRRKGGMKERRDSGLEGYGKVSETKRRVKDRRYAEQERCYTGGIGSGKVECMSAGMLRWNI